jgi:hypothetical protein
MDGQARLQLRIPAGTQVVLGDGKIGQARPLWGSIAVVVLLSRRGMYLCHLVSLAGWTRVSELR